MPNQALPDQTLPGGTLPGRTGDRPGGTDAEGADTRPQEPRADDDRAPATGDSRPADREPAVQDAASDVSKAGAADQVRVSRGDAGTGDDHAGTSAPRATRPAGQPHDRPGLSADAGLPAELSEAGTRWTRRDDGWY